MKNEKAYCGGRELLQRCLEQLQRFQGGKTGDHTALYPTVLIVMGEKCRPHIGTLRDTLEQNWRNARFLQYVNIIKNSAGWECAGLTDGGKNGAYRWRTIQGSPVEAVSRAVTAMLQLPDGIFANKSYIKMEFIMSATEPDAAAYYDLFLDLGSGLPTVDLKTFYLMIDQTKQEDGNKKSEAVWQYIYKKIREDKKKEKCGTLYLLSNFLDFGSILGEDRIWQNYRLIADIVLLGGSVEINRQRIYGGIRTAAYALVTKPVEAIAMVSLEALLCEMRAREEERYEGELSVKDIRERLGIQATNGFAFAEEIFREKLEKRFPPAAALCYLPFGSAEELKKARRAGRIAQEDMSACMTDAWRLLKRRRYTDTVKALIADKDEIDAIRGNVRELLYQTFPYGEARKLAAQADTIKKLLLEELRTDGRLEQNTYENSLYAEAVYAGKRIFYEKIKQIFTEEFTDFLEQAREFGNLYERCENEVKQEGYVTASVDDSIARFYTDEAKRYVERRLSDSRDTMLASVFDVRHREEDLLKAVETVFAELIEADIYRYDFEKERGIRMRNMTASQQYAYVGAELQKALNGSMRLRNKFSVADRTDCFYMVHNTADYAKHLEQRDGYGQQFQLFDLNRTDCIEQIEIYMVTRPESIRLD